MQKVFCGLVETKDHLVMNEYHVGKSGLNKSLQFFKVQLSEKYLMLVAKNKASYIWENRARELCFVGLYSEEALSVPTNQSAGESIKQPP